MTPHQQLIRHDPEEDRYGDCFRTCVACLLDLRPEEVPNWFDGPDDSDRRWAEVDAWFADRGLGLFQILYPGEIALDDILETMRNTNPGKLYILSGQSRIGVNHSVIARGDEIEHDPSGNGIEAPIEDDEGGRYWYVELILGYTS